MKSILKQLIGIFIAITATISFQFKAPNAICLDCTINVVTSYTFTLFRDTKSDLSFTAWNSQLVPAGSNIVIKFPAQYTLTNSQTCTNVEVKYASVAGYTCTVSISAKTITISGAIPTATYIDNILIEISNIKNPSPAMMTSSFVATIGIDSSSADTSGVVTLLPGVFQSITVGFDPKTVNTTSNMIITAVLGNEVPTNGNIMVTFPSLTWTRQITVGHTLPIAITMSCSGITNVAYSVTCTGNNGYPYTVTLTNAFSTAVSAGSTIKFSINNLFSPPTVEQIDQITVSTLSNSYSIDQSTGLITGLTPKSVNLTITTLSSFIINTDVVTDFTFVLADTIRWDTITIQFPIPSIARVTNFNCTFNPTSIVYSNSTSLLTITLPQVSTAPIRPAGTTFFLRLQSYRTPSSVRVTDPFTVRVLQNNFVKMEGSTTISILPKAYSATLSTLNTTINSITSFTISFTLSDQISSSGYFLIRIPVELTQSSSIDVVLTSTSMASSPTIQYVNSSVLRLRNLNTTSANIPVQSLTIRIGGLQQPSSVKNVSNFVVGVYFSSANDLVAEATTTNTIRTTTGTIVVASVVPASFVNADTNILYRFSITLANGLNSGSKIVIKSPTTIGVGIGGMCTYQSNSASCSVSSNVINVTITTAATAGTAILITYSSFTNPSTTQPTGTFSIQTFNAAGQAVDVLSLTTAVAVTMTTPSQLASVSLTRGSRQNSFLTSYTFILTQPQAITDSTAVLLVTFPNDIVLPTTPSCSSGATALTCSIVSGNKISIQFTPTAASSIVYNFTLLNIKNPISFKPSSSISLTTLTPNQLYSYSAIASGLQVINNIPSNFNSLSFNYANQFLSGQGNLNITAAMDQGPDIIYIQFAPSHAVTLSSSISCSSAQFVPICSIVTNSETNLPQLKVTATSVIPNSFTLTLAALNNPSAIPTDFSWVSSYTSDGFKISENKNTVQWTTYCTFPCKQCQSTARSVCTSCYSSDVTASIYLFQNQCLATCPSGYIKNDLSFICQACSAPCYECQTSKSYCTSCHINSTFIYLNRTSTTSTCLSECPIFMYADLTQIPNLCVDCISPCKQCTTRTSCLTCVSGFLFYKNQCLGICPALVTVEINGSCMDCNVSCASCAVTIDNCTACNAGLALYNGICYTNCPGNLISINNLCTPCDLTCKTCSIITTNCTSCITSSSTPFFYNHQCLTICPDFYYADTFSICLSCESRNMGCKNCSQPTVCLSCDPGFVLLNGRCLSSVPDGYLNISGVAVPCEGDCETCANTLSNCTSCKTLNLFQNTCKAICPVGTVPLNRHCQACTYPCSQCTNITTLCTKCASNSSLYLTGSHCVTAQNCPTFTYAQTSTQVCTPCVSPCRQCNSSTICLTCVEGYFYVNSSATCETSCPTKSVGVNRVCLACLPFCDQCTTSPSKCTTCLPNYYYNSYTFECLSTCPTGQIANQTTMQCVNCASPCKTCINTTDTCLSCVNSTFLSNNLCISVCPQGQYGATGLCQPCQNNCTTCSSAVACLSCSPPLVLFSSRCIQTCPSTHSIVSNDSVCISCTTVVEGCSNCSSNGQCYSCYSPRIYFNTVCLTSCPDGYKYQNFTCVVKNQTDIVLAETLQSYSFPIPFTILGCVVFIACCMSKLQNNNTYLIGLLYSFFGIIETASIAFLIYSYFILGSNVYVLNNLYAMLAVIGFIVILNVIGLVVQTPILVNDLRFGSWLKSGNKCFFAFSTLVSVLINYKFKMLLFTKLFKFHCTSSMLQNVYRFRLFNIFSFFGILPQALALYICIMLIIKFIFQNSIFHALFDVIVICIINIVLAVLIVWKPDSFFHQQTQDGYAINKKISGDGEDFSKEAILAGEVDTDIKQYGPDSYALVNAVNLEKISQQLSESLTDNDQFNSRSKNLKVYFSNNPIEQQQNGDTSNPFRKQGKIDKPENIMPNIFSDIDLQGHEQRFSEHAGYDSHYESEVGGSQNLELRQSPKKHSTIVVGPPANIKTNFATENDDINKKISLREKQLDDIKKELDEQQQLRKQKRKSRKKIKKTLEIDLDPKEPEYQQISIKDESEKQKTEQDSNLKTAQQIKNVQLNMEDRQAEIEDDFNQLPKQSIGSWMELRITQENKKLPVFAENIQNHLNTISLPQSHDQNGNHEQLRRQMEKSTVRQKLEPELKVEQIDDVDINKLEIERERKKMKQQQYKNSENIEIEDNLQQDLSQSRDQQSTIRKDRLKSGRNKNNEMQQKPKKQFSYDENVTNQIQENSNHQMQQQEPQDKKSEQNQFYFEQESKDYDQRAGTRLNFQNNNKNKTDEGDQLEDSHHEDERINERPISAARRNKIQNSEALLQILAKAEREKLSSKKISNHQIPTHNEANNKPYQGKAFKHSGGPMKSQITEQDASKDQQLHKRSRMYMAGLHQLQKEDQTMLNKKKTMNYPLNSMKKQSIEDSQLSSSLIQMQKSRNKSVNAGSHFRKWVSKDLSSDNLDDLGLQYEDYSKNYDQLMNQRYQFTSARKPRTGTSGTARSSSNKKPSTGPYSNMRGSNIKGQSQDIIADEGESEQLDKYYRKDKKSAQKKQKMQRNKSMNKQKSFEQTKRIKQLQKIYLSRR